MQRFVVVRCCRCVSGSCGLVRAGCAVCVAHAALVLAATQPATDPINEARDALRKRDAKRLLSLRNSTRAEAHPLAPWVDYWEIGNRISDVRTDEVEAFYQRWSGSYVEDRMRNDWLLELGRRRDWNAFVRDHPRFRMNDDREVTCYWTLTEHFAGKPVADAARALWFAQRDSDDGCTLMASTLYEAKVFGVDDLWMKLRLSVDANRPRVARTVAAWMDKPVAAGRRRTAGQPGALPAPHHGHADAHTRRAGAAGRHSRRHQRPRRRRRPDGRALAGRTRSGACRLGLGGDRQAVGDAAVDRRPVALQARLHAAAWHAAHRAVERRDAGVGSEERAARRPQRRPLGGGAARDPRDERIRAVRSHLDLLARPRTHRHRRGGRGRRCTARPGARTVRVDRRTAHVLRQVGRRGDRLRARVARAGTDPERCRSRAGARQSGLEPRDCS